MADLSRLSTTLFTALLASFSLMCYADIDAQKNLQTFNFIQSCASEQNFSSTSANNSIGNSQGIRPLMRKLRCFPRV